MLVQELKSIHGLKNNSVFSEYAGAHSAQHRMRSAKLKNHLNHKIVTTKVWDFKNPVSNSRSVIQSFYESVHERTGQT